MLPLGLTISEASVRPNNSTAFLISLTTILVVYVLVEGNVNPKLGPALLYNRDLFETECLTSLARSLCIVDQTGSLAFQSPRRPGLLRRYLLQCC